MVRGLVDYIQTLENRIQKLESATSKVEDKMEDKMEDRMEDKKDEWGVLVPEAKFFHADGELDGHGNFRDNSHKKGSYQCPHDTNSLIRALYKWTGDERPRYNPPQQPSDPEHIDILMFCILSKPVSSFFRDRLGLGDRSSPLYVEIGKPFRPLIRNLQQLRDHLAKLEAKYQTVDTAPLAEESKSSASSLRPPTKKGEGDGEEEEDDDVLPFPETSENEEKRPEAYETEEALRHFRVLLDFVDKWLYKKVRLFSRLKQGLEEKIAFEDLWMLFDAGDTIYSAYLEGGDSGITTTKEGQPITSEQRYYSLREQRYGANRDEVPHVTTARYVPQVFRVLGTTGGVPLKKTLSPRQHNPDKDISEDSLLRQFLVKGFQKGDGLLERQDEIPSYQRNTNNFLPLKVVCFNIDFNGIKYGTVKEIITFKPHDGLVDIRSLEAFPLHYLRGQPGRVLDEGDGGLGGDRDPLLERGKRFIDVTVVSHLSYEGLSIGRSREELDQINSAVIVDFRLSFQEYRQDFPYPGDLVPKFTPITGSWPAQPEPAVIEFYAHSCGKLWCHRCVRDIYDQSQVSQVAKIEPRIKTLLEEYETVKPYQKESLRRFKKYMENNDLIRLLPGVVPGFILRNRKWVQLDLNRLSELKQADGWHTLILPKGHKSMIQAMVETHTNGSHDSRLTENSAVSKVQMDLVQECVAAYTRRPLYPITCGDIGYVPEDVEKNMEKHFKLAHKWGCVLLLDETDVFLAKRTKTDVKRNGLVSVFLRILEYYSGILFLTTNRVGAIDDAFRSRLHLTLYYPKLTEDQTTRIWEGHLDRMKSINREREDRQQPAIKFDRSQILEWVELNAKVLQWNGRQIRNAFQTAVALAEFSHKYHESKRSSSKKGSGKKAREPELNVKHFKTIAEASLEFDEYMNDVHGASEDVIAARDQIRQEGFTRKAPKLRDLRPASPELSMYDESLESEMTDESASEKGSEGESSDNSGSESSDSEEERRRRKKKKQKKKIAGEEEKKRRRRDEKSRGKAGPSKDRKEKRERDGDKERDRKVKGRRESGGDD
ncbi:uncharacterized protein DNG_08620 [Cephalotrichum gorgonifer]|uniref:ATPase AAA-type core domain-containing protein n=1 Tax=Cephalotrichum gorgonifer TaxID=2041049 RepID=A0AAE8N3W4_9PEZI|nr:uncharacterized protein DNG_08620 [Cephalotrichum gorgonifer]